MFAKYKEFMKRQTKILWIGFQRKKNKFIYFKTVAHTSIKGDIETVKVQMGNSCLYCMNDGPYKGQSEKAKTVIVEINFNIL